MSDAASDRVAAALERLGKTLAAIYADQLSKLDQPQIASRLSRCGFSNSEIADILGTTPGAINDAIYRARKNTRVKTKKPG